MPHKAIICEIKSPLSMKNNISYKPCALTEVKQMCIEPRGGLNIDGEGDVGP